MLWSVISSSAIKGMLEAKGIPRDRALFVGASRSTCTEANGAGVFNVLARTANQAPPESPPEPLRPKAKP